MLTKHKSHSHFGFFSDSNPSPSDRNPIFPMQKQANPSSRFTPSRPSIKYHRNYRAEFTYKRNLQTNNKPSDDTATGTAPRRGHRDGNQPNPAILPDQCLFCKKSKYKPNTKTREKLHSVQEFRANETVRACASLHIKQTLR